MDFTLYNETRFNCFHVCVAAALLRKKVDTVPLFTQSGYLVTKIDDGVVINPYYKNIDQVIRERTYMYLESGRWNNKEDYEAAILEYLAENQSVIMEADLYYLPFSPYKEQLHANHCIELIGYKNKEFEYCDHYYNCHGTLSLQEMSQVIEYSMGGLLGGELHTHYLRPRDPHNQAVNVPLAREQVFLDNVKAMLDQDMPSIPGSVRGLPAVSASQDIIREIGQIGDTAFQTKLLKRFADELREVSHTRYHLQRYLASVGEQQLADAYAAAEQSWMVIANLIIKSYLSDYNSTYEKRILSRLQRVLEQETYSIMLIQELLGDRYVSST
ncbi:BtrH N-terminal domain-containing protein [Paenibacillus tarimensis]|uniref:BtrH N-terminal domain-containing protein n=1 Tax=Paenibacillus tarimensis TaxID=416012 RepID=UPI001F397F9B|nr:BtrH N-terminal domain-containing protein [Paenibacillus tarimensis]MCF2945729.1 BtrH N-terminal domain-containing protein [Paenibacillus tarimensis]